MRVAFVNNTSETFTPTHSGAIATHVWECCRVALRSGFDPLVFSRRAQAETYDGVRCILLDYPWVPKHSLVEKVLRIQRKLTGWRHLRQGNFARRIAAAIEKAKMETGTLLLHNDPELAVLLHRRFPRAFIIHHFHNLLECRPKFRRGFKEAVNAITAVSDFTSRWVENYYGCGPVTTVYNGVDLERFTPAEQERSEPPLVPPDGTARRPIRLPRH